MTEILSEKFSPIEKYHIIDGCFSYACLNPKERYVYDDTEIKSSKIQKYIKTHRYKSFIDSSYYKIFVQSFELKRWSVDEVINENKQCNPTSIHYLWKNGFKIEAEIDLINLFKETKTTVLFVSHDTEDAMAMADKIVVLNEGQVDQIGTAMEIYSNPANKYVALLFGKTNIIPLDIIPNAKYHFFDSELNKKVVSVRPHQWKIINEESSSNSTSLSCKVISAHPKGALQEVKVQYKKLMLTLDVAIKYSFEISSYVNLSFQED